MKNAFSAWTRRGASGFKIRFDNGFAVSVVWNTSQSVLLRRYGDGKEAAEVGIFHNDHATDIRGWRTPDQLLEILNEVAARSV